MKDLSHAAGHFDLNVDTKHTARKKQERQESELESCRSYARFLVHMGFFCSWRVLTWWYSLWFCLGAVVGGVKCCLWGSQLWGKEGCHRKLHTSTELPPQRPSFLFLCFQSIHKLHFLPSDQTLSSYLSSLSPGLPVLGHGQVIHVFPSLKHSRPPSSGQVKPESLQSRQPVCLPRVIWCHVWGLPGLQQAGCSQDPQTPACLHGSGYVLFGVIFSHPDSMLFLSMLEKSKLHKVHVPDLLHSIFYTFFLPTHIGRLSVVCFFTQLHVGPTENTSIRLSTMWVNR
jgi:hypothetical protein